jgi:ribosomal protein S18 acetylase RimI-like enzyme
MIYNEFEFIDYDMNIYKDIDNWQSVDIKRFATDYSLSVEWEYYMHNTVDYNVGKDVFCKIITAKKEAVAWMVIFCNPEYPVGINPIVIRPDLVGQGLGTRILSEFIKRIDKILPYRSNYIEVGVDVENIRAHRLFEGQGFYKKSSHRDGDFEYYMKTIT